MNDCPDEALLLDFAEGRASGADHDRLARHVAGCSACAEVVAAISTAGLGQLDDSESTKTSGSLQPVAAGDDERTRRVDPLLGAQVGDYRIEERIGVGGMGMVYRALQPVIGKSVAIKVIRPELIESESMLGRLVDEARAANVVGHRNIIDIFSFGTLPGGEQYIVMEYLVGESLSLHLARSGPMPVGEVAELLVELFSALSAAHAAGVVHRDLKPSNLFLVHEPDGKRLLKVLDFGIAKLTTTDRPATAPGSIIGTPEYMSPEQVRGLASGPEADLYAAGMIAWELLTGRRPFRGTATEVMRQHLEAEVPALSSVNPVVPPQLDALVRRLLSKSPAARGRTEQALETARTVQRQVPSATTDDSTEPQGAAITDPLPPRTRPRSSPVKAVVTVGALLSLGLIGLGLAKLIAAPAPLPLQVPERPRPQLRPPEPEPKVEPAEPAAPPVQPPEAQPMVPAVHRPRPVDVKSRRSELLGQVEALRKGTTDPTAQMLLDDAEKRAKAAQSIDDVHRVEKQLEAVRSGYLRKR
ncbi:MAG: protein kinase [Archangiaceae bacterium]|nr:protein kinase [Archangiaceae bacterium]